MPRVLLFDVVVAVHLCDLIKSARSGFAKRRIQSIKIRLHLVATSLIDDLSAQNVSCVSRSIGGWGQFAFHGVHALAENHLDSMRPLAKNDHFHDLTTLGRSYFDLLDIHRKSPPQRLRVTPPVDAHSTADSDVQYRIGLQHVATRIQSRVDLFVLDRDDASIVAGRGDFSGRLVFHRGEGQ